MQAQIPQIIAVEDHTLAGYALSMTRELKASIPVLIPLFERLDNLFYNGRAVKDLSYYVMGQICVDKAFRGQGVLYNSMQHIKIFFPNNMITVSQKFLPVI